MPAGIEAAIVGVIVGLLTPIVPFHDPAAFAPLARRFVDSVDATYDDGVVTEDERDRGEPALTSSAKIGVLAASAVAGVLGYLLLRSSPRATERS